MFKDTVLFDLNVESSSYTGVLKKCLVLNNRWIIWKSTAKLFFIQHAEERTKPLNVHRIKSGVNLQQKFHSSIEAGNINSIA